jgi:adenosylmethionine-8-amino-7-oxononanoate aminotransferase
MTLISPADSAVFHRELDRLYPLMVRAEGYRIWDDEGNEYLDAIGGGAAVVNVGYGVPNVINAAREQVAVMPFVHNQKFTHPLQEELARRLARLSGYARVIFVQGGGEANETAIRLARSYQVERGEESRWRFVTVAQAYHGSTIATLALTGRPALQWPYAPYLPDFLHVPPVDDRTDPAGSAALEQLERTILDTGPETIAAFYCEPVSAAAAPAWGPPPEFFAGLAELRHKYGFLVVFDEVVTGLGRTGTLFAADQLPIKPDIITTAKGLSGGYAPMGAVLTTQEVYDAVASGSRDFSHGHTFNGYPLGCAIALAVLDRLEQDRLIERVAAEGPRFLEILQDAVADLALVQDVRGRGFLFGVTYRDDEGVFLEQSLRFARRIDVAALEERLLIYSMQPTADGYQADQTMLAPVYTTTEDDFREMAARLARAIERVTADIEVGAPMEVVVG